MLKDNAVVNALDDASLLLPEKEFWEQIQDNGREMSPDELKKYGGNNKTVRNHLRLGNRLYRDLHKLCGDIHDIYLPKKEHHFPHLPKRKTDAIKKIFPILLELRFSRGVPEICAERGSGIDKAQFEFAQCSTHDPAYFLSQRQLLKTCLERFGATEKDLKVVTDDDRLRIFGIIFMEDVREYIPSLVGGAGDNRLSLDAWRSRKKTALRLIQSRFIDKEIKVDLPAEWTRDETKDIFDEQTKYDGFYDSLNFNPNNPTRIDVNWQGKT